MSTFWKKIRKWKREREKKKQKKTRKVLANVVHDYLTKIIEITENASIIKVLFKILSHFCLFTYKKYYSIIYSKIKFIIPIVKTLCFCLKILLLFFLNRKRYLFNIPPLQLSCRCCQNQKKKNKKGKGLVSKVNNPF